MYRFLIIFKSGRVYRSKWFRTQRAASTAMHERLNKMRTHDYKRVDTFCVIAH